MTRADLMTSLEALGLATRTVDHQPVFTVAESSEMERGLPGAHTKNLFLKDAKGKLYLVVAEHHTRIDLKALANTLGSGKLSFGKPELLLQKLGVTPGSVTAFAIVNDASHQVDIVIDQALSGFETVNCHPLENTATTNIAFADLLRFIRSTGHEARVLALSNAPPIVPAPA